MHTFTSFICIMLLGFASLTGCHQMTVQQGNILDESSISQLEVGISKQQAIDILGKPILESPFEDDYWDYVYTFKDKKGDFIVKRLRLQFEYDTLAMIVTDTV